MVTLKVFKRLSYTRVIQRTSNHDITNRRSEAKLQKTRKRPNLVFQSQLRLSKFLSFGQFLRHFSTSGGSKKFSMGDMTMSKVFKRLPQIRAIQRTSNHDRTTDHSSFIDKSFNPPPLLLVLDHASLNISKLYWFRISDSFYNQKLYFLHSCVLIQRILCLL